MSVFVIGCLHLGHENMSKYRGYSSADEYFKKLKEKWNSVVLSKKDIVFILGDISMENSKHYGLLNELNGRKKVILGNHDRPQDVIELLKYVESVCGMYEYKGYVLTHAPLHPSQLYRYKKNIHAHIHFEKLPRYYIDYSRFKIIDCNKKYQHVDAEILGLEPQLINNILK